MINNLLNILGKWCKPLGAEHIYRDTATLLFEIANPTVFINTDQGKTKVVYKEGGVVKQMVISGSPGLFTIPTDAYERVYIYSDKMLTLQAETAANIGIKSDTLTQIVVGAPIQQISVTNCTVIDNIISNISPLSYLNAIVAHVNSYPLYQDIIALCNDSVYGGNKYLYISPADTYYTQCKTDAIAAGWMVVDFN